MGNLIQIKCQHCEYESKSLGVGSGKWSSFRKMRIVGICVACREYTTVLEDFRTAMRRAVFYPSEAPTQLEDAERMGDCNLCKTPDSVHVARRRFDTNVARNRKRDGGLHGMPYQCPKCGEFKGTEYWVGMWD